MKRIMSLLLMSFIVVAGTFAWADSARQDSVERLQKSVDVLQAIMSTPDKGIPEEVLSNAKCILVVPDLIKGGFIIGGKHGRGVASCRTAHGWSAPAFVSVGGGSWGLQIGVEGVDLVMLVMNEQGFQHLLSSKFELTGEGFVAAGRGPSCLSRHGLEDEYRNADLLAFEGCICRVDAGRRSVEEDNDSTHAIYGRNKAFRTILSGKVATPKSADEFHARRSQKPASSRASPKPGKTRIRKAS